VWDIGHLNEMFPLMLLLEKELKVKNALPAWRPFH